MVAKAPYGAFLKWGYPQMIHVNRMFHYKPTIFRYPPFMETPISQHPTAPYPSCLNPVSLAAFGGNPTSAAT